MSQYLKIETREATNVYVRKDLVAAVEEVPGSSRAEAYTKLYVTGYSFSVTTPVEEVITQLEEGDVNE